MRKSNKLEDIFMDKIGGSQKMSEDFLYEKSVASVKEACHRYWIEKNTDLFVGRSSMVEIPLIGLSEPDWRETYIIASEHYQGYVQSETQCMVAVRMALCEQNQKNNEEIIVDATVLCSLVGDDIKYASVHITNPKRKTLTYNPDMMTDSYYSKLLTYMYDLVIEYKMSDNVLTYSKSKYQELFHKNGNFVSLDQWFWDMCTNFVVEQDLEKMDMFRGNDIRKRLRNKDYVFDTDVRIKRDEGEIVWLKMIFAFVPGENGESIEKVFIMIKDYTEEMSEKMKNIMFARVDALTQIWNRRYTEELINKKIKNSGQGIFIIFDVDNFKTVNDLYGHLTGDDLLKKIAESISKNLSEEEVVGRLGGDEFVMYLSGGDTKEDMEHVSDVLNTIRFSYSENGISMDIHCSAGVTFVKDKNVKFDTLYKEADKALYEAKRAGRNTFRIEK